MGSGWGAYSFVKSRQYLYFCTSKASKLKPIICARIGSGWGAHAFVKSLDALQVPSTCFTSTKVQILMRLGGACLFAKSLQASSYHYVCVLFLLYIYPHTTIYVSSDYYMCPHTTIYMCPHVTTIYVSPYYYVCVRILLYMAHAFIKFVKSMRCRFLKKNLEQQ